jgi:hypothetical protein
MDSDCKRFLGSSLVCGAHGAAPTVDGRSETAAIQAAQQLRVFFEATEFNMIAS